MKINIMDNFNQMWNVQFPDIYLNYQEINLGTGIVHAFIINNLSKDTLEYQWTNIVNFLAKEFQSKMTTSFERWNLYLIFISNEPVLKHLKYKIENDTFSCRKIVADDGDSVDIIIEKYITKSNLSFAVKNQFKGGEEYVMIPKVPDKIFGKINSEEQPLNLGIDTSSSELSTSMDVKIPSGIENDEDIFQLNKDLYDLIIEYNISGRKDDKTREALNILINKWEQDEN